VLSYSALGAGVWSLRVESVCRRAVPGEEERNGVLHSSGLPLVRAERKLFADERALFRSNGPLSFFANGSSNSF
jgi:hypothetical protein